MYKTCTCSIFRVYQCYPFVGYLALFVYTMDFINAPQVKMLSPCFVQLLCGENGACGRCVAVAVMAEAQEEPETAQPETMLIAVFQVWKHYHATLMTVLKVT